MEGGPYQEYFYIEIPVSAGDAPTTASAGDAATGGPLSSRAKAERGRHRRFVYVQEEGASKFPMQFGLEVLFLLIVWIHECLMPCMAQYVFYVLCSADLVADACLKYSYSTFLLCSIFIQRADRWQRRSWANRSGATGSTACCRRQRRRACVTNSEKHWLHMISLWWPNYHNYDSRAGIAE